MDGFSFAALTRHIAGLYTARMQRTPEASSPFIPFSAVVDEYLQYQDSPAWQRDSRYWQEKLATLPSPVTLSEQTLSGQVPGIRLIRQQQVLPAAGLQPLSEQFTAHGLTLTDGAIALVSLWLARLTGQQPFSAGFIFMRRLGSAALCATGPVINVLPMAVDYDPELTLPALASRLAAEIKKIAGTSVSTLSKLCGMPV